MAKSALEQIRDLGLEFRAVSERESALRREVDERRLQDEKRRAEILELREELAASRQENAVVRQQLTDHIKQTEVADNRRWGLFVLMLGAIMSLAFGLIVALSKK